MLLLQRTPSIQLLYAEILTRRLPHDSEEFPTLQEQFSRIDAGQSGELRADRELVDFMIKHQHRIFHNLELLNPQGHTHQIDTILLTPHFLYILEIKNITGKLFYQPSSHQFGRERVDGRIDYFSNPFDQAYRHQLFLEYLLREWHVDLPVVYSVVLANSNGVIDESLRDRPIFHLSGLRFQINTLFEHFGTALLDDEQLDFVSKRLLMSLHRAPIKRWADTSKIKKGVLCEKCDWNSTMHYINRSWQCVRCGKRDKKALRQALYDYRFLVGERISNKEFREFMGVDSIHAVSKILVRLNLQTEGKNRGRVYIIPENILED